jgi:uncharacterized protein YbaP (TraB family)
MDLALTRRARERGLPVEALETWDAQLAQLGDAVGIDDLVEAIEARRSIRCDLSRNLAAYRNGDPAWMLRVFATPLAGRLVRPRNQRWLPAIEAHLGQRGAFVAVGIGHLLGDDGLPAMLEAAGYRVEGPALSSPP